MFVLNTLIHQIDKYKIIDSEIKLIDRDIKIIDRDIKIIDRDIKIIDINGWIDGWLCNACLKYINSLDRQI